VNRRTYRRIRIVPAIAVMFTSTTMNTAMRMATETRRLGTRAERILAVERLAAPATRANTARNARAERDRHARWALAREALWRFLDVHLPDGVRVAILGAGNCDDLPLERIAARAGEVTLIDLDARAIRAARRRQPPSAALPARRGRARRHRRRCGRNRDLRGDRPGPGTRGLGGAAARRAV
jgi:hypothetical protein